MNKHKVKRRERNIQWSHGLWTAKYHKRKRRNGSVLTGWASPHFAMGYNSVINK